MFHLLNGDFLIANKSLTFTCISFSMSLAILSTKSLSSAASGGYFSLKGGQTQIIILIGSGIAFKGKGNQGKNGVIGKYGAPSKFATGLMFPKSGYISSPPI